MSVDQKTSKTMVWIFVIALLMGALMVFLVVAGRATQLNEQELQQLEQQRSEMQQQAEPEAAAEQQRSPEATGETLQPSAELPEEHEDSD